MDQHDIRVAELVSRYFRDEITPEELSELIGLADDYPYLQALLQNKGVSLSKIKFRLSKYFNTDLDKEWHNVLLKQKQRKPTQKRFKKWWVAAASIVAICLIGGTLWFQSSRNNTVQQQAVVHQVLPGRQMATLTLSDGSVVQLNENEGRTVQDGKIKLNVSEDMLDYSSVTEVQRHILRIPIGGTYHLQLADGTKVWLNADSELKFPSAFVDDERRVEVRGEAYFEIAKDTSKPFRVSVNGTVVEALGTAFNINTHLYPGKTKTILTEGKIKVTVDGQEKVVEQGYETISGQGNIQVKKADIEEAMAWKDGYFYFNNKRLKEVLEEVARWYKVDLDVQVSLSNQYYVGGIKKNESIETVTAVLQDMSSYKIMVQGRTLIVKR